MHQAVKEEHLKLKKQVREILLQVMQLQQQQQPLGQAIQQQTSQIIKLQEQLMLSPKQQNSFMVGLIDKLLPK